MNARRISIQESLPVLSMWWVLTVAWQPATQGQQQPTYYVNVANSNPAFPYTSWETAATNIQDAVDAAPTAGAIVLVTNGVYRSGTVETNGPNRVGLTKRVTLRSVNGPEVTVIDGAIDSARCAYVSDGAVLSGFTLTNGTAGGYDTLPDGIPVCKGELSNGGGVYCEPFAVVTNCVMTGNHAFCEGGGAYRGTLYSCRLVENSAGHPLPGGASGAGGGVCSGTLYDCVLMRNISASGGGASGSILSNCTLTGNSAGWGKYTAGGGATGSTLYNCRLIGNSAWLGGGASCSTLYDCGIIENQALWIGGGGVYGGTLYNCTLTRNSAAGDEGHGGGAYGGTLYNCTLTGNSAVSGGGAGASTLSNCIVYYNTATNGANYEASSTLDYCCTTPLPANGVGNITGPPLFIDRDLGDFRLREDSPCIDAGVNLIGFTTTSTNADSGGVTNLAYTDDATDTLGHTRFMDGNGDGKVAWDMGAYEFNSFKPPRFTVDPQLTPDGWKLNVTGASNKWVTLQRSNNFKDWEDIWSGFMEAEGVHQCTDEDTRPQVMFYRGVVR